MLMTERSTRGAVRFRDGGMSVMGVLAEESVQLRRAGFSPFRITLDADDGTRVVADLWMQDTPSLCDYLNAANLLFDTAPGSVHWEEAEP